VTHDTVVLTRFIVGIEQRYQQTRADAREAMHSRYQSVVNAVAMLMALPEQATPYPPHYFDRTMPESLTDDEMDEMMRSARRFAASMFDPSEGNLRAQEEPAFLKRAVAEESDALIAKLMGGCDFIFDA
jgi:hypothetical protein